VGSTAGIIITVSDGTLTASLAPFNLTVVNVNDAPVISGTPLTSVNQGEAYSFVPTASDVDGDTLTFSISNLPGWASFNAATGALTGTPGNDDVGSTAGIIITVSDGTLTASLAPFNLTVVNVNDAPLISGTPATSVNQGEAYSFVPTASDMDGDTLTFSISNPPAWASFDSATGALTGTPGNDDVGSTAGIVITVSDGELSASLAAFNIEVVNVNDAPLISGTPSSTVDMGTEYVFTPTATDPDDDELSFSIENKPEWATFDSSTGALTGTPKRADVGTTENILIVVSDGELTASLPAFSIEVLSTNAAPIAVDDNFTVPFSVDGIYLLDVLANDTDPDEDVLKIIVANSSIGTVNTVDNALQLTLTDNVSGTVTLGYTISDDEFTDSAMVTLIIEGSNPDAPVITVPADLSVAATGLFTKVEVGVATAVDKQGNRVAVSLVNGAPLFAPGKHELYWRATDAAGVSSTATQLLQVQPLVSLSKPQTVMNNSTVVVEVILNGLAPVYPVTIPYTVTGTASHPNEHSLHSGEIVIPSGLRASLSFDVFAELAGIQSKNIVIALDAQLNLGANAATVVTITEANLPPVVQLSVRQQGENRQTVGKSAGTVSILAQVLDPNAGDNVTLNWQADAALQNSVADNTTFAFSPEALPEGLYRVALTATDNGVPALSNTAEVYILVRNTLPVLTSADSNNNLIPDNLEGLGDANGNGIPDYLDPGYDCNVIPEQLAASTQFLAEGEPGICLRKGADAALSNGGGIELLRADLQWLEPDMQATNIGGVFDFILFGLPVPGDSYRLVVPQRQPLPQNAVYRKYTESTGWRNFVVDAQNQLFSSAGEPGFCPPPGTAEWQPGLTAGHWCVQLLIADGGPNDADGLANGSIVDPGGVAVVLNGNNLPVAVADNFSVQWNQTHRLDVLANDQDPDGDDLTINQVVAAFGFVEISADGQHLWYTPQSDFVGTDTVTYSISDGRGGSASATVTVNVYYNRAPQTGSLNVSTDDRTPLVLDVLSLASDADGDNLQITMLSASQGAATVTTEQQIRYVPRTGFSGSDTISYTISDGKGGTAQGTVLVTVKAYEVITVVNKSSGGAMNGWPLLLLVVVLVFRRGYRPAFFVALLSAFSFNVNAQWSADIQLGQSNSRMSETNIRASVPSNGSLVAYDDKSTSWALGGQYQFTERFALQLHYVDLGETSLTLTGDTLTPEQYHRTVSDLGPMLAAGVRTGLSYTLWQQQQWQVQLQTGVFIWRSKQESTWDNSVIRYRSNDTDLYWGAQLSYALNEQLSLQAAFNRYRLDANQIDNIMLGLSFRF